MTGFHSFRTFCFAGLFAFALAGMLIVSVPLAAWQGSNGAGYRVPPKSIADLVDAPLTPVMRVGPNQQWMLLMMRPSLPSIEELSQPESRIAGLRINPRTNGPSRARFSFSGLVLQRVSGGEGIPVKGIPAGTRIGNVSWSPDGVHIAFTVTGDEGVELWVAEAASAEARRLLDARVSAAYGGSFAWLADSQTLFVKTVPASHGAPPEQPRVPAGPILQENTGRKAPARTYQDLLKSAYDEELFEYFTTAQVVRVTLAGESQPIGRAGIVRSMSPSPDGKYLLVQTIQRPFSYLVPAGRFPYRVEVWDGDGNVVKQIADRPLADNVPVPFGSVPTGPRSFGWRSDTPATLYWTEAQDGGDAGKKAEVRDRVYTLAAPFTGEPQPLITLGLRFAGIQWSSDDLALVNEFWWRARKRRIWRVRPGQLGTAPELLFELATEDRYNDPGSPATRRNAAGKTVLRTGMAGQVLFFLGQGASPEGNRPFLDERNLITGEIRRLWRSEAPYYERVVDLLNLEEGLMLTSRESVNEPPNYFVRNLRSGELSRLTRFPHPTPQLTGVHKELIKYPRADGVNLSGTLYLPPGKKPADGPFPVLMWAYPREYKDAASAGQVRRSPYRFVRISPTGSLIYLAAGYAIFDDPIMPIIGEGDTEPNDSYVKQLVSSAKAAVNVLVERGIAERGHIAIAGHSYGAFMVANLLAHSDLFAAGIARSGAYNRTLTPFGFQAEQRTFWQAPEIYFRMSPFMHADKVNEPILLIHGEADNNSGTFPIQSRRFYHALKGHGATARLVMLPHESHGYRGRESVLHMLWETVEWLDRYVGGQ